MTYGWQERMRDAVRVTDITPAPVHRMPSETDASGVVIDRTPCCGRSGRGLVLTPFDRYVTCPDAQTPASANDKPTVIAETLRYLLAQPWLELRTDDREALCDIASQLEHFDPQDCCPLCEEIDCDEGCPLRPLRAHVCGGA